MNNTKIVYILFIHVSIMLDIITKSNYISIP